MNINRMAHHQWDSAQDPETVPLFLELQWAHARSLATMRPLLAKHGLSAAEFDVLATLRNAPAPHEMTPSAIQDAVVITSGGLTKVMLQLEARGLVERLQHQQDLRIKPIRLTESGRKAIEIAMAEMIGTTAQWIRSALDADQIRQLTALLGKLADTPVTD